MPNKTMQVTIIAGARPNFMKVAPIIHAIQKAQGEEKDISYRSVHTGQHYDKNMSDTFFEELEIPQLDVNLGCGGGTQAEQTAHIMVESEKELLAHPSNLVLVVGDVTSTMACSIVAKKLNTKVAHVEAGIRSWDLTMPEEINSMVTDSGGITEETTVMGVPCITLRDNTERPETCTIGTNELIGTNPDAIKPALDILFAGNWKKGGIPEMWDGHAAERIIEVLTR